MSEEPRQDETQEEALLDKQKPANVQEPLPPLYTETLMEIFEFSEMDLNTNRSGFATRGQKALLNAELKNDADAMWLMLTIMLGAALVVGFIMTFQGLPMIYLVLGAGIMLGGLLLYSYLRQNSLRQDTERTRVLSLQGDFSVHWSHTGRRDAALHIAGQTLPITTPQAKALAEYERRPLRVYYAEHSKLVLSAEVLPDYNIDKLKVDDSQQDELPDEESALYRRQYQERE